MTLERNVFAAALALGLLPAAAQQQPAAAPAPTVVIQDARILTMGPQGTIENGDIVFRDGVIVAVGADLAPPAGATVIPGAGRIVTPGLFAPFSQIGLEELSLDAEASDSSPRGEFPMAASLNAVDAYNPTSTAIPVTRAGGGVTRALAAPTNGDSIFAGRAAVIDLSGRFNSVTKADAAQVAVLGYGGAQVSADTRMGAWAMLRETLDEAIAYAANPRDYALRRDDRFLLSDLAALGPVVAGSQPLMVAVDSAHEIRNVLKLKNDYRLNVIILGGAEGWRVAREIAQANVPVILDPLSNLPSQFEELGSTLENAARLNAAGVSVAFINSDSLAHNQRLINQAAGNAVANGMPYDAALAAITINPARMFGLGARLGSLEPGKAADVVIWDGDPLEVTSRPIAVFIDGRAMSMETRQTKLRDRYRDLSRGELPFVYRGTRAEE
jgi:imidazolonepropionase-like amidohydrolase